MKCPIDDSELVMSERQGIEIDYCPECRGVWLDRGELDKVIERSEATAPRQASTARAGNPQHHQSDRDRHDQRKPGKKKSLLSEIFDI